MTKDQLIERLLLQLNTEYLNYKLNMITRKKEEVYAAAYEIDYMTRIYVYVCDAADTMDIAVLKKLICVTNLLSMLYQKWLALADSSENELDSYICEILVGMSENEYERKKEYEKEGIT